MKYCIGIDGGGSKTLAYLSDDRGNLICKHLFGPTNHQIIGKERFKRTINKILDYFSSETNFTIGDLKFISLGMAGLDRKSDKVILESIFEDIPLSCDIILQNDSYTSLAGALNGKNGVILASGTGSVSLGKKESKYFRVGGWTHVLGDEGSGYSIGLNALKSIMKVYDGRLEKSGLYFELLKEINVSDPRDTISFAYENVHDTRVIAGLTPLVFKYYEKNDSLAVILINKAVDELYHLVNPLIQRLYIENKKLLFTYSGSIILESEYIKSSLIKKLQEKYPNINPVDPIYDAAVGALIIGWSKYNLPYEKNLSSSIKNI